MWTKAVVESVETSGLFPVHDPTTKEAFMVAATSSLLATKQEMYFNINSTLYMFINLHTDFVCGH